MITAQSAATLLAAAAVARAFGPDVRKILHRMLAAGVRTGASEMTRSRSSHREGDR